MKSFLYAGAALMIVASIYGFVDYKNTSHKKEFNDMYAEKKAAKSVVVTEEKVPTPVVEEKTEPGKKAVKKTTVARKEVITDEKKNPEEVTVAAVTEKKKEVKKKKRKISTEIFSRAPLREEEDEIIAPAKTETKKTENKEL